MGVFTYIIQYKYKEQYISKINNQLMNDQTENINDLMKNIKYQLKITLL